MLQSMESQRFGQDSVTKHILIIGNIPQGIYQEYAALAAASLISKYQGKTRISQKGNRITVNFYLSDSEKAFITFFRDNMPWNIPDPPENSESLRMICSQKNSPFIIVSLSKQDRRYLKK